MMKNKFAYLIIVCVSLLSLGAFALLAQDMSEPSHTLEEVASFPSDYYGSTVEFDGYVSEFVSSPIIVIGENAIFDNDMVLVVSRTGEAFPLAVTKGAQVRVTGQVYRSLDVARDETLVEGDDRDEETIMIDGENIPSLQFVYDGHLRNEYNIFTIIVVENADAVEVLVGADGEEVPSNYMMNDSQTMTQATPDPIEEATDEPMDDMGEATEEATEEMMEETPDRPLPTEEVIEPTATPE